MMKIYDTEFHMYCVCVESNMVWMQAEEEDASMGGGGLFTTAVSCPAPSWANSRVVVRYVSCDSYLGTSSFFSWTWLCDSGASFGSERLYYTLHYCIFWHAWVEGKSKLVSCEKGVLGFRHGRYVIEQDLGVSREEFDYFR